MRKKIATLLLAFAFILPCSLLFTACMDDGDKDKAKVTSISVTLTSTDYTMTDNTITIPWGGKVELDSSDFEVIATLDDGETKVISEKTETQDGFTFSSTIPTDEITPIGEYSIIFSHEQVEDDIEIDVNVVKLDVDMTGVEWNYTNLFTYDKTEKVVELTGLPTGVTVEYKTKLSTESGYGEVGNSATNAGSYTTTAIFTYSDTEHYNTIPNMVINWEIEKADIVVSSITTQPFTYDGTEKTATITSNLPEGVEATITGENTATNAGTYNIVVSFEYTGADSANYNPIANLNASWTINPTKFTAVGEVGLKEDYALIYNGANQTVELDFTGLDANNVEVVGVTGLTAKNAGTYKAIVELAYIGASTNYDRVDNIEVEWAIGKAPLTVTAKDKTITYGDSATNDNVTYTGFVGGETSGVLVGSLVYDYSSYDVGSSVGSYDITPRGLTSTNYEISFVKGTLIVQKKALTIKANDATIDYNTDAINNGVVPTGLIPSDTVEKLGTLVYNYGGYEKGSIVGTYDITVSGLDDTNYIIAYEKGTLTVEKIDVAIDVTGIALVENSLVYTGTELSVEVDNTTLPDDVSVTNIVTRDKVAINVDEYTAVIYLQYKDTTNYNPMEEITRTWNIEKSTVGSFDSVALDATEFTYTGLQHEVEFVNIPAGATVGAVSGTVGIVVDEYTVEVTFVCADTDNYINFEPVNKTYTWNIMPAMLTVTANDCTITYGENPNNDGYTAIGFVNGETESVLTGNAEYGYTYSKGEDVGIYDITVSGLTGDNYTINFVKGTLTVEKAKIDFADVDWADFSPYYYDGEVVKPILNFAHSFISFTYSYTKGGEVVENPTDVGTYLAHVAVELTNDNYEIVNNVVADFEYHIIPQKVDVSTLVWNTDQEQYTGEQILPEISELPNTLTVEYTYTQNNDVAQPINVGEYVAHAEIRVISNNYEIEGTFADLTYYIIPQEVDCSALAWEDTTEFTFDGEEHKPTLKKELNGLKITYAYFEGEDTQIPAESVLNVGTYTALVEVQSVSENYTIINYTQLQNITFAINKMQIDISDVEWESLESTVYTGEAIKPVLAGTENIPADHMTFEYYYTEGTIMYPVKDVVMKANINPVNVGEYEAWAFITLAYQSQNYEIVNDGYVFLADNLHLNFVIEQAEAVLGSVDWNINSTKTSQDEYSQYHNAILEYNEEPIAVYAIGDLDMFDIEYDFDYNTVDEILIENVGNYNIYATITLKEEYQLNYWFGNFNLVLWLEVIVNPFEFIYIDGEEISYQDFVEQIRFEYLSEIEFELKEGYTAHNNEDIEISGITLDDTHPTLIIRDGVLNEVFSKQFYDYYYIDRIVVEDIEAIPGYKDSVSVNLAKGQDQIHVEFNDKYIFKYGSKLCYEIFYEDSEPVEGILDCANFIFDNATSISQINIFLKKEFYNVDLCWINVVQYSRITEIQYTTASLNSDETNIRRLKNGDAWIDLNNEILVEFKASVESGYTVKYFADRYLEEAVDFTDLNNMNSVYVAVYSEGDVVETRWINISQNLYTTTNINIRFNDTFNTTESALTLPVNNLNTNITLTSLLNGNETLILAQDITVANYVLTIEYNSQTYIYSRQITVVKTLNVEDCVSEEALDGGTIYLTNTDTKEQYSINTYNNSINLYSYYDASTIKYLDLDALEFPVAEGYIVSNKELVPVNGKTYLKLTLTSEQQTYALTESEYTIYILLEFDGIYDSDTSGEIEVFDLIEGYISVPEDAKEINIDIATQGIDITLNNNYAKAVILDAENRTIVETNEYGYLEGTYNFTATGTYTLIITATDGTAKTYTINVTGELLPTLEVVVGDITLSQENGQYGPTEGDFKWEVLDEDYTEMSFTAAVGDDAQLLITEGEITITSLRSSMLAAATVYDNVGTEITNLNNFTLSVLGDENTPYVMFYAIASVQGQTTTTYILLYLCDEIPAEKVLEVVVGDKTFTEVLDPETDEPYGDFDVYLLADSNTEMEMMFIAYLGTYEETPKTLTLDSIYCVYSGIMTDLVSGQTFTALEDVTLSVGIIENNVTPCVAYAIEFSPMQGYTIIVDVVLYLIDESDVPYPVQIAIGENSYDLKLNAMSFDFGDVTMDMDNYYLYITETTAAQNLTEITITLDRVWTNYSYMVLIDDAYDNYLKNVELDEEGVYNSNYIDSLIAEGTKAFRVTDADNLTMTIPVLFDEGLAYFDIAVEGFVGYLPEDYVHDMTFARCYIVIDGVGKLPEGGNAGGEVVNPGASALEFTITLDGETLSSYNALCVDKYGDIYIRTTKTQAELITKGLVADYVITIDSFTCKDGYYFFTVTGTNPETQQNIYVQLANGGHLSSYIVDTNEYGYVAQIMVYDTTEVDVMVSPVHRINIIFADSEPYVPEAMEQPAVNVTVVAYNNTFSTANQTLAWDAHNRYFYTVLTPNIATITDNYITIDSCVITNLDGSETNLTFKGVLNGEYGNRETITFDTSKSLYMYAFDENLYAGYIEVYDIQGAMLYSIAIAFDDSSEEPEVVMAVAYSDVMLMLSSDGSGNILKYNEGDTSYFYAYLGSDAYTTGATELTLDAIFVIGTENVVDAFNTSNVITLTDYEAEEVILTIGQHKGINCVAIQIVEGINLYLYLADVPNSGDENPDEEPEISNELPLDTEFTITIGSETLVFDDLFVEDIGYVGQFSQYATDLEEDSEITAFVTTNLEGEFETMDKAYEISPNEEMEIKLQVFEDYGDYVYVLVYNGQFYFIFTFEDSALSA